MNSFVSVKLRHSKHLSSQRKTTRQARPLLRAQWKARTNKNKSKTLDAHPELCEK